MALLTPCYRIDKKCMKCPCRAFSPAGPIIVSEDAKGRFILAFWKLFSTTKSSRKAYFLNEKLGSLERKLHGLGIDIF
jgi:hypothetical protein